MRLFAAPLNSFKLDDHLNRISDNFMKKRDNISNRFTPIMTKFMKPFISNSGELTKAIYNNDTKYTDNNSNIPIDFRKPRTKK